MQRPHISEFCREGVVSNLLVDEFKTKFKQKLKEKIMPEVEREIHEFCEEVCRDLKINSFVSKNMASYTDNLVIDILLNGKKID